MKRGLFGGTFDPVHFGHLRCAQEIGELFSLDQIIFIPAYAPPHKDKSELTAYLHREAMIALAIEGNELFTLSDVEARRKETSYSVDTVTHFMETFGPNCDLHFIVGQDAFQEITLWKEWERLLALCHIVIMTRPGYTPQGLQGILPPEVAQRFIYRRDGDRYDGPTGNTVTFRHVTFLDISSTDIRRRIGEHRSIRYLVPEPVEYYIAEHKLYRNVQFSD